MSSESIEDVGKHGFLRSCVPQLVEEGEAMSVRPDIAGNPIPRYGLRRIGNQTLSTRLCCGRDAGLLGTVSRA